MTLMRWQMLMCCFGGCIAIALMAYAFKAAADFFFAWKHRSAKLILEEDGATVRCTVSLAHPGKLPTMIVFHRYGGRGGSPPAAVRPVRAGGWAGWAGAVDVALGPRQLGLAVSWQEAEWIAALLVTYWLQVMARGREV
jgi:hypothetical protein